MRTPRKRILCVDDHEDSCYMLKALLGASDYEAISAGSMNKALELARSEHFDLYILDTLLMDGSGLDLCVKLRERDRRTPIVFYSGAAYSQDKVAAFCAGAQAYILKPHVEELVKTVDRLLGDGTPPEEAP